MPRATASMRSRRPRRDWPLPNLVQRSRYTSQAKRSCAASRELRQPPHMMHYVTGQTGRLYRDIRPKVRSAGEKNWFTTWARLAKSRKFPFYRDQLCAAHYFSIRNLRLSKNCRHSVAVWAEMVAGYFGVASPSVRESEFYGMRQKRAVDTKSL